MACKPGRRMLLPVSGMSFSVGDSVDRQERKTQEERAEDDAEEGR